MKLKKIKYPAVIILISMYVIGIVMTFSGDLILQIQSIRYQNQIERNANLEFLEFSEKQWANFENDKEIKYKNQYFDVIWFRKLDSKIIAKVVKDSFESETRVTIVELLKKNKPPISENKKSNTFYKHLISENKFYVRNKLVFLEVQLQNFDKKSSSKTKSFIYLQDKPPC